jgi:hypothetical protein
MASMLNALCTAPMHCPFAALRSNNILYE